MPKAVPLTYGNINAESTGLQQAILLTDEEVVLSLLPLFHAYSQTVNLWQATIIEAQVYYVNELNSAAFCSIEKMPAPVRRESTG